MRHSSKNQRRGSNPASGRPAALALLVALALLPPLAAFPAVAAQETAPDSAAVKAAQAARQARPSFVLPDVLIEGEDLSRFATGPRGLPLGAPLLDPARDPELVSPGATRYRRRVGIPFRVDPPPPDAIDRLAGGLRLQASDGASRELGFLLASALTQRFWGEFIDWRHRFRDRGHRGLDLGFAQVDRDVDPARRLALDAAVRHERWAPNESYPYRPSDAATVWKAAGACERRVTLAGLDAVMSPRLGIGGSEIRAARGGWQSIGVRLRPYRGLADARLLAPGAQGAGRIEFDVEGGFIRRRNMEGDRGDGRARGRLGWSGRTGRHLFTLGVAGGREGSRGVFGPWFAWRHGADNGWMVGIEMAPVMTWFDEWWGRWQRLAPPNLVHEEDAEARLPFAAQILDPVQPAQRAWPRAALEARRGDAGGSWFATAVVAQVADPFNWVSAQAAGQTLPATSHGARRRLVEIGLGGERMLRSDLRLAFEYRWMRDEERGTRQRLLLLPEHRLRGALAWEPGAWRVAAAVDLLDERFSDADSARLPGTTALSASLGRAFGAHTVSLVGENLLDETLVEWPGEVIDRPWFGVQWRYGWTASAEAGVP